MACNTSDQRSKDYTSNQSTVIYLVRHAEKQLSTDDPKLTAAGIERAAALAKRLHEVPLSAVYSTDYHRTRETAEPVAQDHKLPIQIYDPRSLEIFADRLKSDHSGQSILVVGHSNTTPTLSNILLGEEKYSNLEESVYDQLFSIAIEPDGSVTSSIEQFGKKSE